MKLTRDRIQINEGGYVCGVTWVRGRFLDIWFRLPIRGCRSHRYTHFSTKDIK
jgi:hypothetical protein